MSRSIFNYALALSLLASTAANAQFGGGYATKSGNSNIYATTNGALTNGHCVSIDASGNFVDAGSTCGTGGGGVTAGTAGQLGYYQSTGANIVGLTLGTGVLTGLGTNPGAAGAFVIYGGAGGVPSSLTLTNASGLPIAGITGLGTGVSTGLANPTNAASGLVTYSGALGSPTATQISATTGQFLTLNATSSGVGALAVNGVALTYWNASTIYPATDNANPLGTLAAGFSQLYTHGVNGGGAACSVSTVSALAAANFGNCSTVDLQGYNAVNDGGGGLLVQSGSTSTDFCTIFDDSSSHAFVRVEAKTEISAVKCGAYNNNTNAAATTTAFQNFWSAVFKSGSYARGHIEGGTYAVNAALTWDIGNRALYGADIYADGFLGAQIVSSVTSGTCFQLKNTQNSGNGYYMHFSEFRLTCATSGATFALGTLNGTDNCQSCKFDHVSFQNTQTGNIGSTALQLNGALQDTFTGIQASNSPASSAASPGSGSAIEMRGVALSTFIGCTCGNAYYGIYVPSGGTPVWPVYDNVFITPDIENVSYVLYDRAGTSYSNQITGGKGYQVNNTTYGYSVIAGANMLSAGAVWTVDGTNGYGYNNLYGSSSQGALLDPVNQSGIIFRGGFYNSSIGGGAYATPSVPASGTGITNTTGQAMGVNIWGGAYSVVAIKQNFNGATYQLYGALSYAILQPGDSMYITYSSVPSWLWRPLIN